MIDSKVRDYSYVDHHDKFPLELKGTMKKKVQRPNTATFSKSNQTVTFGNNAVDRKSFMAKIMHNFQELKSIVPYDTDYKKVHGESKKMVNQENYLGCSGVSYLMVKSSQEPHYHQRKHLDSRIHYTENKREGEKKHFEQKQKESTKNWEPPKHRTCTLEHKIESDLYSNVNRRERALSSTVRLSDRNMFREGINLGYDGPKTRRISCSKFSELEGTYNKPQKLRNTTFRDDWRKSSIVLG